MLRTRIITATTLLVLFILVFTLLDESQFGWVMLAVSVLAAEEWGRLSFPSSKPKKWLFVAFISASMVAILLASPVLLEYLVLCGAAAWLLAPLLLRRWAGQHTVVASAPLVGLVCILPTFCAIVLLRGLSNGAAVMFFLWAMLFAIWAADVGAYFAGKAFGRTRLAPLISPKKTWEGLFGGLALNQFIAVVFWYFYPGETPLPLVSWLVVCLLAAVFSVFGDLLVSVFKRMAGVKDSGRILPGHGGVLDRIDGVMAGSPVFVTALYLFDFPGIEFALSG